MFNHQEFIQAVNNLKDRYNENLAVYNEALINLQEAQQALSDFPWKLSEYTNFKLEQQILYTGEPKPCNHNFSKQPDRIICSGSRVYIHGIFVTVNGELWRDFYDYCLWNLHPTPIESIETPESLELMLQVTLPTQSGKMPVHPKYLFDCKESELALPEVAAQIHS